MTREVIWRILRIFLLYRFKTINRLKVMPLKHIKEYMKSIALENDSSASTPAQNSATNAVLTGEEGSQVPSSQTTQTELVKVQGSPLSVIFSKALDVAYGKKDPETGALRTAIESQAQDAQYQADFLNQQVQSIIPPTGVDVKVYTVNQSVKERDASQAANTDDGEMTATDVFNDAQTYIDPTDPVNFVFVTDDTKPSVDSPEGSNLQYALPTNTKIAVESITVVIKTKRVK